ncbi:MAG: DRTGG domain-containing protein [Dehalococcoidia bacterium]
MPVIVVTSAGQGDGKTGVATAIARHYAYLGQAVRLTRIASTAAGSHAPDDAAYFASLDFVPGSPSSVESWAGIHDAPGSLTVVEVDAVDLVLPAGAAVVTVSRSAMSQAPTGVVPVATVVTAAALIGATANQPADGPLEVLLGDDRTLAGFSVAEARAMLNAEVLVTGDETGATCDHLVIAPIASDAGQPYFRRFASKAVVVRFDKTDMHLAAMRADPACLILTGGRRPSDYLFDAATAKGVPVLLSRTDTENTVIALEGIFDNTRFSGERKLDRMCELLEQTPLFDVLGR